MTIVISLAIQGPLLPGTAIGTLAVIIIAARGRPAARSGLAGRAPAPRERGPGTVADHTGGCHDGAAVRHSQRVGA